MRIVWLLSVLALLKMGCKRRLMGIISCYGLRWQTPPQVDVVGVRLSHKKVL